MAKKTTLGRRKLPPPAPGRVRKSIRDEFGLSPQQRAFADQYLVEQNGTRAYIAAGYRTKTDAVAASGASELLRNPNVASYLDSRLRALRAKFQISQERVLQEVARIAYFDLSKLFDETGAFKPVHLLDEDTRRALASIEIDEVPADGKKARTLTKRAKAHDKVAALEKLMRYLQLYREGPMGGLWIQPPDSGSSEVSVKVKYTAEESYRRMLGG